MVVTGVGLNIDRLIKLINILRIIEASATDTERKRSCGVGSTEDTSETSRPLPPYPPPQHTTLEQCTPHPHNYEYTYCTDLGF